MGERKNQVHASGFSRCQHLRGGEMELVGEEGSAGGLTVFL